jgi:asparagine synthase (glutamine-hydrolysing)
MCGILGAVGRESADPRAREFARSGLAALAQRGPDGSGIEWGETWMLAQTRLAILDLTDHAAQPMADARGRWLVFNGEIYNFRELRRELEAEGVRFQSTGDTQVLLEALGHWGVAALPRLRGMFAFAWLDPARRELLLARDRYGVKPLVFERMPGGVRFASDLFALDALAGGRRVREIDAAAVRRYLMLGYVPAPFTIWKGPQKLRPGHYLSVRWSDAAAPEIAERCYWSPAELPPASTGPAPDLYPRFKQGLRDAVRSRLVSDVPVGILLSGGVDSSLVAAAYAEEPGHDIPSFTMGFEDGAADERPYARSVADELDLAHEEFTAEAHDVAGEFAALWSAFDEPFADSSAMPTMTLCRGVRRKVKVVIGGDGGDEVWCGYPWHRALARAEGLQRSLPLALRRIAGALPSTSPEWRARTRVVAASDRLGAWTLLRTGLSDRMAEHLPVAADRLPVRECFAAEAALVGDVPDVLDWAGRMDLVTYLPDDLMVKADRASMRFGLELREPLLDHEFTAFGLRVPTAARFDGASRQGKLFARRYLSERLTKRPFDRPKQGFTPPLPQWLAGPLAGHRRAALADLAAGRLAPLALPAGAASWEDCAARLDDRSSQFLWRVICFWGWSQARSSLP